MHLSAPFIQRPVATSLLSLASAAGGLGGLLGAAGGLAARRGFPGDRRRRRLAGGEPGDDGVGCGDAAGAPVRAHRRRQPDDFVEFAGLGFGDSAVRHQPQYRRRCARRAGSINAARSQLPSYLPQNPSYRKANPAEAPILILTLTSDVVPKPQIYDMADSILAQKISQIQGVGQVFVGGSASPAVRVELNPCSWAITALVLRRCAPRLPTPTPTAPRAHFRTRTIAGQIDDNDQIFKASDYAPIIAGLQPADRRASARRRPGHGDRQRCRHPYRGRLRASTHQRAARRNLKTRSCSLSSRFPAPT